MIINPAALAAIRSLKLTDENGRPIPGSDDLGRHIFEALRSVQTQATNTESQTNANPNGQPTTPPNINSVKVTTGPAGEFQIAINDTGEISRGINYFAEHATTPAFSDAHAIDMGQSRNYSVNMGSQALHWRAYSAYPGSQPSALVYHGGSPTASMVQGGVIGVRAPSQGTGTAAPGHMGQGPGPVPQRSATCGYNWKAQSRS